jgi:hypothetical protein
VGLATCFVDMQSAAARPCPSAVQQTHAGGQLPIRAAPVGDPCVHFQEVKVAMRQIRADFRQETALNRPQSILRYSKRHRYVTNPSGASGLAASCAEGVPARRVFAVAQVPVESGKGGQQRAPDFSIQNSNFRIVQNRAGIPGQLLRESDMRRWWPVTVHDIFSNIFMPTTVHIPDPLLKSVDRRAKALGISRNRLVVRALEQAVSVREGWSPEFLQRLRHVDRETSTAVDELLATVTQARRSTKPRDL